MKPRRLCMTLACLAGLPLALAAAPDRRPEAPADRIVVQKAERALTVYRDGEVLKRYRISLGRDPLGPKEREGDGRTPEGRYVIDSRVANERFHLALHISYPGPDDRERAAARGVAPGGGILIHGLERGMEALTESQRRSDWTDGCIAVTNEVIEEIWRVVPDGTLIEIVP